MSEPCSSELKLHLDAEASSKALQRVLASRGHDVTRAPTDWMVSDASDERLLGATAHGRSIFTFNVRDFLVLAKQYPQHGGIILVAQASWSLGELIKALDRLVSSVERDQLVGQVRWLNAWRER